MSSLFAASLLLGQTTRGTVRGSLRAEDGRPVAGAALRLTEVTTAWERTRASGPDGDFTFPPTPPGAYSLEVNASGYGVHRQSFTVGVNQAIRLDLVLTPPRRDTVEVTSSAGLIKAEQVSLGGVVDNLFVSGLPLDGRNFQELTLLTTGTYPPAPGSAASIRGEFAFNVNGAREDGNSFLLDGVYNNDPKLNSAGVTAAVDAIREFEVATSTYDASFGRNAGAQVNVILKSGTNQVHGTFYEFVRNDTFDARNFFAPATEPAPRYQRNQFGFSVGGPLCRNRSFFFGDYEGRRVREGITRLTNVPTALERAGDFSQSGLPFLIDPFVQQPFPGARIPRERLHPTGMALVNLYPAPNRAVGGQNFVSSPSAQDRNDQFDARIDHRIATASELTVRYSFADRGHYEPFSGATFAAVPGFGVDVLRRAQNVMLAHTHAFSPTWLNEFRAAYARVASGVFQQGLRGAANAQVGLPVISPRARDAGLSFITVPGYSPLGDEYNNPQESALNSYQVLDTTTVVRGRHLIKAGFDFRRLQQNAYRDVQSRGFLNFLGFTGSALAELLQGLPAVSGVARLDNPQYLRLSSYNAFVNNSWRASSRLTVSLGVRYELNSPPVDRYDHANLYDPGRGALVGAGRDGMPRGGYRADRNNFGPRLGLAYALRPGTVLRAGYGIYYDLASLAPGEGLYFNAPYFDFRLFYSLPTFPLLLHNPFPANYPLPIPGSALGFQDTLRTAYLQHWNLNLQRGLGSSRVFEVGYAGSKGTKLLAARDINQPAPSATAQNPRPNFRFDDVTLLESRAASHFHSLQARFQQRFAHGLSAIAGYTWAKSIDDASSFFSSAADPNFPQDSRNARAERARSNFDVRHRLTLSYAYDLPLGRGRLRGGWQAFGIWAFQSGRPFTVALLPELDNSGTGRSILGFGANDRPHYLRDARLARRGPDRWFDTAAFALPARGEFGSAGRNILDGPGLQSVNASLVKNIALRDRWTVQLRLESFNLFNRANFDLPDPFFGSPTFGRINSAQAPRHIQFGVKLLY